MEFFFKFMLGLAVMAAGAAGAAWIGWRFLKRSENPGSLVVKWIVTAIAAVVLLGVVAQMGVLAPPFAAVIGLVLGIIWAPSIGAVVAKPFTAIYDGGAAPVEERPFYSIARARQKRGQYLEAVAEVKKQLQKFPSDYEGWMLLAELYAENLKDNDQAQACIQEVLRQPNHAPKNIAYALNRSADWHLALGDDRSEARSSLEQIAQLYPDSEHALSAAQRIAHLPTAQSLAEKREPSRIKLVRHEANIGLAGEVAAPKEKLEAPGEKAGRLVAQLNEHPLDLEAREELAVLYAEEYGRLDLAADQVEQLIAAPGASQKQIARSLNLLADLHIRTGQNRAEAEQALRRIMELFPGTAAGANAEKRLTMLDIEFQRNKTSQAMKLGSYEQNIGLKGQVPRSPN